MFSELDFRQQHARYGESSPNVKDAVDAAFLSVVQSFKDHGLHAGMGDEAEELVAAIHHFFERSGTAPGY